MRDKFSLLYPPKPLSPPQLPVPDHKDLLGSLGPCLKPLSPKSASPPQQIPLIPKTPLTSPENLSNTHQPALTSLFLREL